MDVALSRPMGVKSLDELVAYQQAVAFKLAVYSLVNGSDLARGDFRYRSQLFDAAASVEANIAEGWGRCQTAEMQQFLRYARASLEEARRRLADGIARGYFSSTSCEAAFTHANRCGAATTGLWKSLNRFKGAKVQRFKGPNP